MDTIWQEIVAPKTGQASYESLRAALAYKLLYDSSSMAYELKGDRLMSKMYAIFVTVNPIP
jgi:hypothetical protein